MAARWQDGKILLVLPDATADNARRLADRLRRRIAAQRLGDLPAVTVSAGVGQFVPHERSATPALERAAAALGRAKEGGRNCVA